MNLRTEQAGTYMRNTIAEAKSAQTFGHAMQILNHYLFCHCIACHEIQSFDCYNSSNTTW